MRTLEDELSRVDNDPLLLSVDTKIKTEAATQPQISPCYNPSGNPMVAQYTHRPKVRPVTTPQVKSSPLQGVYGREESYNLHINDNATLPDVTQHGQNRIPSQNPMIVQQIVQSPLYVNLGATNVQQLPEGRTSLLQLDGTTQVTHPSKPKLASSQPLLIQNNAKTVTPLIIKTSDASFSPVVLQSNINPEAQTFIYTSAPVQGKYN